MSEQKSYGVECKNKECRTGIILGSYMTKPQKKGDIVSFVVVKKAGSLTCPKCGKEYRYEQEDIREFSSEI